MATDAPRTFTLTLRDQSRQDKPTLTRLDRVGATVKALGFDLIDLVELSEPPPGCRPVRVVPDDGAKAVAPPPVPAAATNGTPAPPPPSPAEWRAFAVAWFKRFGDRPVTGTDLHALASARGLLAGLLGPGRDLVRQVRRLRLVLLAGPALPGFRVRRAGHGGGRFRLEPVTTNEPEGGKKCKQPQPQPT